MFHHLHVAQHLVVVGQLSVHLGLLLDLSFSFSSTLDVMTPIYDFGGPPLLYSIELHLYTYLSTMPLVNLYLACVEIQCQVSFLY